MVVVVWENTTVNTAVYTCHDGVCVRECTYLCV